MKSKLKEKQNLFEYKLRLARKVKNELTGTVGSLNTVS